MSERLVARVAIATMVLLWGTTWAAIRIGLDGMPPLRGIAWRFAIASLLMASWTAWRGQRFPRTRQFWLVCLANGLLLFTVSYAVVYWCEQWLSSGLCAVIFSTYPLLVMLLAHFVLAAEPIRSGALLGMTLSLGGVIVIFSEDLHAVLGPGAAVAAVLMMLSPIASAGASVAVKKWGTDAPPLALTTASMTVGAIATASLSALFESDRITTWTTPTVLALLYLAVFGSAVTFGLYFWLLAKYPVRNMALIAYGTPVVAVIIGGLLGEPFTLRMAVGAVLVVGGVAWALSKR